MKLHQPTWNGLKPTQLKFVLKMKKTSFLSIYHKMASPNIDNNISCIKQTLKRISLIKVQSLMSGVMLNIILTNNLIQYEDPRPYHQKI